MSRITAGRLGGGHQVGFDRLLANQPCEYPRHHWQQYWSPLTSPQHKRLYTERFGYFFVPDDRYGGLVSTAAALPGRISAFVQWFVRTPWPVFTLSQLQADIIGALLVLGFLRYGLPPEDRIELQELPALNLATFTGSIVLLFLLGTAISARLLVPVFR